METQLKRYKLANVLVSLAVVALCILAVIYRQDVLDWWRLRTYTPGQDIVQLANATTMVDRGRDLFFASRPVIEDREAFNANCTNTGEKTIVLGCYRAQRIYLFNVTDERLAGVKEVTAAHEMLHAVYERMGATEREALDKLLAEQMKAVSSERILGLVEHYREKDESQLYNEMHSILGTEYRNLSPQLEEHFRQYFTDRQSVVALSEGYEGIFEASRERIAELDGKLAVLKQQIDTNNAQLETMQAELQAEADHLSSLRNSDQIDAYNAAVPAYNEKVRSFNARIAETKRLVDEHNVIVEERNREIAAQNDLNHSLDSRQFEEVPQN